MKKFRIQETFRTNGWTYVMAETEEEAIKKIENGEGNFREEDDEHDYTDWDSLEEVTK